MQANLPRRHLYTACTQPYFRAPQIYIAMPTRFMDRRGAATDILFMTTRGGNAYDREFTQSFIRPGLGKDGWANRANYAAIGIHQTSDTELSMFLTGGRRYKMRLDGFVSVNAPLSGGEFITKPLTFTGKELEINYATSAAGSCASSCRIPMASRCPASHSMTASRSGATRFHGRPVEGRQRCPARLPAARSAALCHGGRRPVFVAIPRLVPRPG